MDGGKEGKDDEQGLQTALCYILLAWYLDKEVLKPNDRQKDSSSTSIQNTTF